VEITNLHVVLGLLTYLNISVALSYSSIVLVNDTIQRSSNITILMAIWPLSLVYYLHRNRINEVMANYNPLSPILMIIGQLFGDINNFVPVWLGVSLNLLIARLLTFS
jgi:hypothetical protein